MSDLEKMQAYFVTLCMRYGLPVPFIRLALDTDPCDFTSTTEVRFNLNQDCERDFHVRHVFGHYLCDWHEEQPDLVADIVAKMIKGEW